MPRADPKRALLFLHVPKAGGTALAGVLGNRFAATECLWIYDANTPADDELNAARFVTGHVSMSIRDRFERPPFTITALRDPIERALSTYSYLRGSDEPPASMIGMERNRAARSLARQHSIDEFIRLAPDLAEHYLGNWQARMLAGSRLDHTDELLEAALRGLHRCDLVGLSERQTEFADLLARRLGWALLNPLPLTNVTRTRLQREQVPPAAMDALLELTSVDRDLYAEAVRLNERRASSADTDVDDATGIEDAPLVSDLSFGEPVRGVGWLGRERSGEEPDFCWVGHTARARVDLADHRAARSVVVEIGHVIHPSALASLRITVNGEAVQHRLAESNGAVIASAPLELRHRPDRPVVQVAVAADRTTRPCDINPGSSDNRELSVAVRRIALV